MNRNVIACGTAAAMIIIFLGLMNFAGAQDFTECSGECIKGSITVCKVITDSEGNIVDGSEIPGVGFLITGYLLGTECDPSLFTTPITLSADLLYGDGINDSECVTFRNLPLGTYHYSEESIEPWTYWEAPKYNDQLDLSYHALEDFNYYNGSVSSDGYITLTKYKPSRILGILNHYVLPAPVPECDLMVSKADYPDPVMPGEILQYQLSVFNNGSGICEDVAVEEFYDNNTIFNSSSPAATSGNSYWDLGNVSSGETVTIDVLMDVPEETQCNVTLTNEMCVSAYEQETRCVSEDTFVECLPYEPYCGNAILDEGEECDYGINNSIACNPPYGGSCDYCSASCQIVTLQGGFCGNEIIEPPEECDDGNNVSGDGCSDICMIENVTECTPGETRLCSNQNGVCSGLTETCSEIGTWPGCNYAAALGYENPETSCDAKDNDCDGLVDEGYVCGLPGGGGGGGGGGSSRIAVCGDSYCSTTKETCDSCPEDCGACNVTFEECVENWVCGGWSDCHPDGFMNRSCEDYNQCNTTEEMPAVVQSCAYISPPETTPETNETEGNLPTGAFIGLEAGIIAGILVIILLIALMLLLGSKRKKKK